MLVQETEGHDVFISHHEIDQHLELDETLFPLIISGIEDRYYVAPEAVLLALDLLVTGCFDYVVRTFSVSSGQPTRELRGHTGLVFSLALSDSMLVSGDGDRKVKVWAVADEASAECVATLEHGGYVFGVVAGADFVAAQGDGNTKMIVWRPE